jgi:5-methylcytosine-specific restriction endonuclease McrA
MGIDKRFDINNCRTLCQKCHYRQTFGKDMPEGVKSFGNNYSKSII